MSTPWLIATAVMLSALGVSPATREQIASTPARPVLELEKTRFASSEDVFFWVGIAAPDDYRIPKSLWSTCRLTITRPDGSQRVDDVGWPIDGNPDRPWRGGRRLGSEPVQIGRYVLVFEFAGLKTTARSFTVEDVPILREITGQFVFPSPLVLEPSAATVGLTIRNGSRETIRFPHRGEITAGISVGLSKRTGEPWSSSFFVPQSALFKAAGVEPSSAADDSYSWEAASRMRTVVLGPGETYRLELPLNDVLSGNGGRTIPAGGYDVRLSTVLQMLVGSRDGAWAGLAPIRWNITSVGDGVR